MLTPNASDGDLPYVASGSTLGVVLGVTFGVAPGVDRDHELVLGS